MQLTGKEKASLCVEEAGKALFTICQLDWYQLLNDFICEKVWDEHQNSEKIQKFDTRYITIDSLKLPSDATVKLKFKIFTKATPQTIVDDKYETTCKIKDFYNHMISLFSNFANKQNTTLWNIGFELIGLEIVEAKPIMKIKIYCTDSSYFKNYIETINKYSIEPITIKIDENDNYYTEIEVTSLDFLPQLEHDVCYADSQEDYQGIIFSTISEGYYCIEIYNGYRE